MEQTFFFLKPDAVVRRYAGVNVLKEILNLDCQVKAFAVAKVSREFLANKHYCMHKGKPFFDWLIEFVSWGDLVILVLEREHIIESVRNLLGPKKVEQAIQENPLSIRAKYGMFGGVNVAHASDSKSSALHEISLWREELNLRFDNLSYKKLDSYIAKYDNFKCVRSNRYREIMNALRLTTLDLKHRRCAQIEIAKLLEKENSSFSLNTLVEFAGIILKTI
jgi:nucleoside-diphosphate kinase